MTITYYFEPYMFPVGLLLIFLKNYILVSLAKNVQKEMAVFKVQVSLLFSHVEFLQLGL